MPVHSTKDQGTPLTVDPIKDHNDKYPLNYNTLVEKMRKLYSDFKRNSRFHTIKKEIEQTGKYSKIWVHNPNQQDGKGKLTYRSNIFEEFDKHYTRIENRY
jgi:hypothetical protein